MKDRANGAKTYVKKNHDGTYSPVMKLGDYGEQMCPGAHTFATEKGAERWLEDWEKKHVIVKTGSFGWKIERVFY